MRQSATHQVDQVACPACRYVSNRATNITGTEQPEIGDWSVCTSCGTRLRYGAGGRLRVAGNGELMALSHRDPNLYAELAKAATHFLVERVKGSH